MECFNILIRRGLGVRHWTTYNSLGGCRRRMFERLSSRVIHITMVVGLI